MPNYEEMSYYELKSECKKEKLDTKGTAAELRARLGVTASLPTPPETEIEAKLPVSEKKKILPPTQADLEKYLPEATFVPKVDVKRYQPWLTEQRLKRLAGQLDTLAAGKGRWNYQIDKDAGSFQVEFSGRLQGPECTTLIDNDAQILKEARIYFTKKTKLGGNNLTAVI